MNNDLCTLDNLGNLYVIEANSNNGIFFRMYKPGETASFASTPLITPALTPHVVSDPLETNKIYLVYVRNGTGVLDVESQKIVVREFFVSRYTRPDSQTTVWQPDEHYPVQYNFLGLEDGASPKMSLPHSIPSIVNVTVPYTRTNNTVTLTFPSAHRLSVGSLVNITNLTDEMTLKTYTVTSTPTPLTLAITETSAGPSEGSVSISYATGPRTEFLVGFVATDTIEVFGESVFGAPPVIVQEQTVTMKLLQFQIREDSDDNNIVKPLFESVIPTGSVITKPETFVLRTDVNEIIMGGVYEEVINPTLTRTYIRATKINGLTFSQVWVMQHNDRINQQDGSFGKTNLRILKFGNFTFIGFNGDVGNYYLWKIDNRGRLVWPLNRPGFVNPPPISTSGMLGSTVQNLFMFNDTILLTFLTSSTMPNRKIVFRKISSETGAILSFVETNLSNDLTDIKSGGGNTFIVSQFPWEVIRVIYRSNAETVNVFNQTKFVVCPVGTEPFSDISQNQIASTPDFKRSFTVHSDPSGVYVNAFTLEEDGSLKKQNLMGSDIPIPNSAGQRYPVVGYFNNALYVVAVNVCVSFTDFMKMNVTLFTEGVLLGEEIVYIRNRPENYTENGIRNMFPVNFEGTPIRDKIQSVIFRLGFDEHDAVVFPTKEDAELAARSIDKQLFFEFPPDQGESSRVRARIGEKEFVRNWTEERIIPDTQDVNFSPKIVSFTSRVIIFYTREDNTVNVDYINANGNYLRTITVQHIEDNNVIRMETNESQSLAVWITPILPVVGVFTQNILIGTTMASNPNRFQVWRFNFGDFSFESKIELNFGFPNELKTQFDIRETEMYDGEFYAVAKRPNNQFIVSFVSIPEKSSGGKTYNIEFNNNLGLTNILSNRLLGIFNCFDNLVVFAANADASKLLSAKITVNGSLFMQEREEVLGLNQLVPSLDGKSSGCLLSFGDFTKYYLFGRINESLPILDSQQRLTLTNTIPPTPITAVYGITYNEIETIFVPSSRTETYDFSLASSDPANFYLSENSEYQGVFDDVRNIHYVIGRMNPSEKIAENDLIDKVREFSNFIIDLDVNNSPIMDNIFPKGTATAVMIRNKIIEMFTSFGQEFVDELVEMFDFMLTESSDVPSLQRINMIDFIVNGFTIPFASVNLADNDDTNFTIRVPPADYTNEYFVKLVENRLNKISTRTYISEYGSDARVRWTYERPRMIRTPAVNDRILDMPNNVSLNEIIDDLRSLSVSQVIANHPFDLQVYQGVTESNTIFISYPLALGENIGITVNWVNLSLLPGTLNSLFNANPTLTSLDQEDIENFAREKIRLKRMTYLADELKGFLNAVLLEENSEETPYISTSQARKTYNRVYSYELDENNELQWSYFEPSRTYTDERTTSMILTQEITFPTTENLITVPLERFRLKLNADSNITQNIYSYRLDFPKYKWFVRQSAGGVVGSPLNTIDALWNIAGNVTTFRTNLNELKAIIDFSTGNNYTYTPEEPTESDRNSIRWSGPGFTNSTTDNLLINATYRNRSRELTLLEIRNTLLTGNVEENGTQAIYNYDIVKLANDSLEWSKSFFPLQEIIVGLGTADEGSIDSLISELNVSGRNLFMSFIGEVMNEITGNVFTRVPNTTRWRFTIPQSRVFEPGAIDQTFASLPQFPDVGYVLNGVSKTSNLWNFLRDRLDQTSPLRIHNYYDFDERFFDSPIPMFRRWYYETIIPFAPENVRFLFAGPDTLTLEKALGIPEKILNLNGNYAISFNTIESIVNVPANYNGITQTTLSMEVIEDFGIPFSISIAKDNNRVTFLSNLITLLNSNSASKIYSGSFVGNRIRLTYIDKISVEEQIPGRLPTGTGAVAFKFTLNSPMGTALGFTTSNPNELVYSFNILYSPLPVDVSGLGEIIPIQEPEGLYIKAFNKDGFEILLTTSDGFDSLQTLLDPEGQNGCITQDEENVYVCYLVSRKTLSAFTTFHVKRYFKSSLLMVWEEEFVLPDADINKLFPRLLYISDEVHLYYGRNDDRIYARVFESLSGLQRNGKVCDLNIKMCYPDKRELKVIRSLQSLNDVFYTYISFPDGTTPFGSRITLAKYLSSSYSLAESSGHWDVTYGSGSSIKTNLIVKEDPRNQEIFISFTDTPSSGPITIQGLCIRPNKTLRYTIPVITDLTNLVRNRILGMFVFDECLVFFGLTNSGQVIGYKARTTDGTQVDDTVTTALGFDVSDLQIKPFFVYIVTPWDRIVIGTITMVKKDTDIFENKTTKFDFLISTGQGGITITDTEVSQFQAHLDKDDNIYSVTYVGGKEGLNLTKFDPDGNPVVQRTLTISGQSPAITGDETGLYASYTLSVDTFVKYLGVYVVKLRSSNLTDIWNYTRLYEEDSPTPFQTRIRVFRDRIYTVYVNNENELIIQVNRARTGQLVGVFFSGINVGNVLDPKEITIEPQNDKLLYIALPEGNGIRIVKYNIRDGCCTWDRSVEVDISGVKTGIILRYNPQLQNDFFAFDYDLNEVLSKDEMRDYLESVGIEDKTEEIWDQFGINKSLSKTQMANYLETNNIEDDVDQIWIDFGLTEDQGLSKSQMNEYLQTNNIDDDVERIWEFYSLNDVDGLVYDQFAEYMYSINTDPSLEENGEVPRSFRFINRNGLYLVYSSGTTTVRMVKMNQLGGEIDWSIDTEMDTLYGGRAHAFYITNDVPLIMGVDDTTADLVANKYEPTEGTLISSRRRHLITFDKDLFTNYPHIFSREIWDCIWIVYPNPSIFYAAQPGNPNAEKYQNWVTLVNKALALPIPEPSETFVKLSDKQAMNDCDDCLYVTYVTEEGPNNVTLSKLTYDGVTQFVKELDFGGQSPSVHVVGDKAVVAYVKKLVTFTEIIGLYVLCVRTDTFETVWKSERLLNDSFVEYFKPRVQKSDKGIHVAYFRQDGCMYIDTYEIDTGVLVGVPFCVTQIRTPDIPPTIANLAIIGAYVDELDVHSTECLFYAAIPDQFLASNIKFLRVDALTMADPLTSTELIFFESGLGSGAFKRSIQLETSKGDLYDSVEQLTIGYTEDNSIVKVAQLSENFSQNPNWVTPLSTNLDNVFLKQMHGMYVDGEITIVFFVRKQGSKVDVVSVKVDTYGNQIEEHVTQGPTNRTILYDKIPMPSTYVRSGDIATITTPVPHKLYDGAPVILSESTIDTSTFGWSVSSSATNNWNSVAWSPELSRFVTVSTNGTNRALYSSDGLTWVNSGTPPPASVWKSVVWSPQMGMFVAVGTDNAMYSMNGINWQTGSQPVPVANWTSVIWSAELGLFVAVADSGVNRAMRSSDGITWVLSNAPPESGWQTVAWSPERKRLIAFANSGTDRSMISEDGISWFAILAGSGRTWRSVTWSPYLSRFVAVADGGSGRINYSGNGTAWNEAIPSAVTEKTWRSVIWADQLNRFIAVGPNSAAQSFDGINWTNVSPTILTGTWNSIVWASLLDRFVVVGTNSIIRKQDGAPLTSKEHLSIPTDTFEWYMASTSSNNWSSVTWSPELSMFVVLSINGSNRALYSFDGLTWFSSNTPPPLFTWRSLVWSPQRGMFVAVGTNNAMYSMDGINWQTGSQPVPAGNWMSVTWSPEQGLFVAVAEGGVNRAMLSIDGVTWVLSANAPPESAWQTITWSSERNRFLAFARTGTVRAMSSTDGNTWTTVSVGAARNWMSVTWSPNLARYVAVADGGTGRIAYSNNGTTWITSGPNTSITDQSWKSVFWVAQLNRFIVVGPNVAAQSLDGITWSNMSPTILSGSWNSTFWSPFLERLITVGTNAIMFSGLGILSFQVRDIISGSATGDVTALNRYEFTVEEFFNSGPIPQVELDVDHGVDSETIEGYPYVISRAPWDFAFVEYYNTSQIQVLQQESKRRLAIVGLESPGETRNGVMTPFTYSQSLIPDSEVSSYQMVATQNGDTFLAFNDTYGLKLTRIRPDGSSFGTRTTILIDQYGQSPTITCFEKVEETEVYEAILVSYVRRQTGFTSMTVRINLQYRADTMQCIETDNCKPSEYYFLDTLTSAFRPRVDISADKIYVVYKRQDDRLYIDKLDRESNQYDLMKQIREDFSGVDSLGIQVRTYDENFSILYPTAQNTFLRRFTTDLDELWLKQFEVTHKARIEEEEEGIFLAYKDDSSQFKVCSLSKETGQTDWTTILTLPPIKGEQIHSLFVLFGYPLVFNTSTSGDMVVSKLFPNGDLASQRSTLLPSLNTSNIINCPVILTAPPHKTVTLGYYTNQTSVNNIPAISGEGIVVQFYTGPIDHNLPLPKGDTATNQFIQFDNEVLQVHTDEPNRLMISRHNITTGDIIAMRLVEDEGGYPFRPILKMGEDDILYLSYIKYEIVYTEIVELVIRAFDPVTLEPLELSDDSLKYPVRRALPDPSPDSFRPRIFILNNQLVRTYVRFDEQINVERLNLVNFFLQRPQRLGILYDGGRNPDNIHYHREDSRVLFIYPISPAEDLYRVSKINPTTLVPIWSVDMNLNSLGVSKENPDLRFDEEFNVYYMSMSSSNKGFLTKFRDSNGNVEWTKPFEVNSYRFDGVAPETSSGDNIEFDIPFGTDLQFIVNTPGAPMVFRRKSTMEILGDGVSPGQTLSNGRIVAPTQGVIAFRSGFLSPGEYLYASAFDSKMTGRIFIQPPIQDTFVWNIVNSGGSFTVSNNGVSGTNLDINVIRKDILEFNIISIGDPVSIVARIGGVDFDVTDGIENNGIESGVIRLDTSLISSSVDYYYVTKSTPKIEGRIILTPLSLSAISWNVTISDFRPRYYNQGMAIFEHFPLIFTVPGYNAMMVHKFSDLGVLLSNKITRLTDFQYEQVAPGCSTYSASLYPWRRSLIFHDTDDIPALSYNANRRRSARSFDSGVFNVIAPITANIRTSQGAQDSRKTAVVTFYQVDPPGWASGVSVYFFQGRRPNDLCRRLVSGMDSGMGFQPSLSKLNGEDVFYLTYIRAIETFTEVQYLNMHVITADVMLQDLWVMEEQRFIDGRWQHFRPLIKIYEEVVVIVYIRQNRRLVIETRSKENGELIQRLTTTHEVPDPEEMVIGGDFDLMVGFPNGDHTITLLQFQISDLRAGIQEVWSAPFISDFGEAFRQKRSLEITQNVTENLVAAFLSSDFIPMDEPEDITLVTAIGILETDDEGEFIPFTQTFYDTVDQRLLESRIDLFKTLDYLSDSRIHGRSIIMIAALRGDDFLFNLIFTDAAQGMTEQNFGRHMWFFKNFGIKTEYVERLESLSIVERKIGLDLPREQYLYVTSIEKDTQELLWTQRAQTSNFTGVFENTERISGITYDGAFVGVTRIGRTLVDNNPFTIDAFTYSINNTGSRVREIQDRFDENQPPSYSGTPLFMLDMADEFGIMAVIIPGGEFKIYRVFSTGGSVRVPFDGDGRAIHPTYTGEDWWRPFITINPVIQGTSLEEDIILNIKDAYWTSVVWTGNNFVALGPSTQLERVMVSSTGKSWTGVELDSEFDKQWVDAVWAQGALNLEPFVIAALAETEDGNSIMTTTDAINWTLQETPVQDVSWSSLVWDNQLFVAVGKGGSGKRVMVSGLKGFTKDDRFFTITAVNSSFAVSGFNSNIEVNRNEIVTLSVNSPSKRIWIKNSPVTGSQDALTVGVTNNGAIGSNATIILDTSIIEPGIYYYISEDNAIDFGLIIVSNTDLNRDNNNVSFTLDYSVPPFKVTGTNDVIRVNRNELVNLTINSPNSRVWISKTPAPGLENSLLSGLSDNGVIGSGQSIVLDTEIVAPGTYYYVSEENPTTAVGLIIVDDVVLNKIDSDAIAGVDWEIDEVSLLGNLNSSGWRSIAWSPKLKRFVAVAFDGSTRIMVSLDGCNWRDPTSLPSGTNTTSWTKVIWATTQNNGDGYYVAVATTGQNIAYSTDGDVWFLSTASQLTGMNLSSIAWSRVLNMFVVVSTNGDDRIATSIDLRHWVKRGTLTEKAIFDELVSRISPTTNFITVPQMRRVLRELHFNIYEPSNVNTGSATWLSTTIDKFELPYMAYRDSSTNRINVRRYNGNAWVSMGTNISAGDVSHVSIKTDSLGNIIIAYRDSANGNRLSVRRYNGVSWATLGSLGFSVGTVEFVNLLVNSDDKIYVIYRDNGVDGGKLVGRKFENSNWLVMGAGAVSTGIVSDVSVVINSIDQIFVAFSNKVIYTNPNVEFDELVVYQYSEVSEAWAPSSTNLTRELTGTFVKTGNLVTVSTTIPNPNPPPADIPSSHGLLRGSIVIIRNSSAGLSNGLYIVHSTEETSFTIVDSVFGNTSGTTTAVNVGGVTSTMLQVQLSASYSRTDNAVTLTFPRPHGIFPGTLVNIPNLTTGLINRTYTVVEVPTPGTLVVTETSPGNSSGSVNVTYPGGSRRMEAGLVNLVVNPRLNPVDVPIDGVFDKYLAYQQRFIDVDGSNRFLVFVKKNTDAAAWFDTESSIVLSDTVQEMKMTGDPYGNLFLIVKEPFSESQPGVETLFSERLTIYSYKPNTNWVKPVDRRGFTAGKVSNINIVATVNSPHDISDTTRLFITFSDATRGNKPTMISFYPITLQNTVVAIENMIRDAANLENDDIDYVDFSNLNYSPPKNNWSSIIWSDGAIGPTETGSFMAVSSNSSVDRDVIVYNIPTDMDERVFRDLFVNYGVIEYSAIFRERATGSPLGYGIVRFTTLLSAENASKPVSAGGMNGALVRGRELTGVLDIERGVADRAIRSVTGLTWPVSKTIRDVGAGSFKGWFTNGQLKFEKRYAIEGPITGLERNYSNNGQWSKEIGHTGVSNTREFIVPTRMNLYELFRRFFVRKPVDDQEMFDDETIDKEDLLCGIRSFNLNIPRLPEGSSPLDKLFQRMGPNQNGRVDFKGFSRVVATDHYTRDIVNKIGFDRAILTRNAQTIDGLKDGILTEFESSLPAFMEIRTANYIKDVQNGPEMRYYSDSSLRSQVNFVNGLRVGDYIEYLPREFGILKPKLILEYDNRGYETQFKTTFYPVVNAESLVESRIERFSDPRNSNIQVLMENYWRTSPGDPVIITNGAAARSYPNNWVELVDGANVTRVTIPAGTYNTMDEVYTAIKNALNANSTREFDYTISTSTLRVTWSYTEGTGTVAFRFGTVSSDVLAPTKGGLNEIMGFRVSNQVFQFSFVNKSLSGPLAVINSPLRETIAPIRLRTRCFLTNLRAKLGPLEEYTRNGELIQRGMYDNNLKVGRWETIFEKPRTLMVRNAKRTLENYSKGKLSGTNALQVFNEANDRLFTKNFPVVI